jgi:phospholipid/cholesterol/gamma-HCH transport system substrate-binding protein
MQNVKLRLVSEISGVFVLVATVLLLAGIYFAGKAQGWFEKRLVLHTRFVTSEGTFGIQEGAEVRILGTLAGRVGPIIPSPEGGMETSLIIRDRFRPFVKTDSIAKVRKKFEVAGDAFFEITLGTPDAPVIESASYLRSEQDVELIKAAQKALDEVLATLVPMLDQIKATLDNVRSITDQIDAGHGLIGRLIMDDAMASNIVRAAENIDRMAAPLPGVATQAVAVLDDLQIFSRELTNTTETLPATAVEISEMAHDLKVFSASITGDVEAVQGVLYQTQSTLRETERLIQGLQNHWLVRDYMPPPEGVDLLDPSAIPLPAHSGGRP